MMNSKRLMVILILIAGLGLFLPNLGKFVFPFASPYNDIAISHYPNLQVIKDSIREHGQIPLWSDHIFAGVSLIASPISGLLYPPAWLLIVLPVPFGFNILLSMHLLLGAYAVYLLLENHGVRTEAAILGGLAFELAPKLVGHIGAGHLTLVFAVCLTPWLLYLEKRIVCDAPSMKKRAWRYAVLTGLLIGLIALADIRWLPFALACWLAFRIWLALSTGEKISIGLIGFTLFSILLGIMLSAPLVLPLLETTADSTRSALGGSERLIYSLPVDKLFGLMFPDFAAFAEWMLYPGAVGILSIGWCAATRRTWRRTGFWLLLALAAIIWSLGEAIPGMNQLSSLPGLNLLRVPARTLFLLGISVAFITGFAVDDLLSITQKPSKRKFGPGLVLVFITGFAALITIGAWGFSGKPPVEMLWGAVFLGVVTFAMLSREQMLLSAMAFKWFVSFCLLVDLLGSGYMQIRFVEPWEVLGERRLAAEVIAKDDDQRVYSPSYSIPQQTAAYYGLEMVNGIDPIINEKYQVFFGEASGIPVMGYTVILPPFLTDNLGIEHRAVVPDTEKLGWLNVGWVAADFPINVKGLKLLERVDDTYIYKNEYAAPFVWKQDGLSVDMDHVTPVDLQERTPNRVVIAAEGPGVVVSSSVMAKGWRVWVDGKLAQPLLAENLLRGVRISEGRHEVVWRYFPISFAIGLILAGLGVTITCLVMLRRRSND